MLNGEFERIDNNRTILSFFVNYTTNKTYLEKLTGELYKTTINGENYYLLAEKDNDFKIWRITDFKTGCLIDFYDGKQKALKDAKTKIEGASWTEILKQHKNLPLNCLDCEATDTKHLQNLIAEFEKIKEKQQSYCNKRFIQENRIDVIKDFLEKGENKND